MEEERWHFDWAGAKPRQALVDALAELLAARWPADSNDFDATPLRNIPFLAYQEGALAWESGGTETAQRGAVKLAPEMNAKLGKEQAYYLLLGERAGRRLPLLPAHGGQARRAVHGGRVLHNRAGGPGGGSRLRPRGDRDGAKQVWPYWLDVIAVHILTESVGDVYWYGNSYGMTIEGWPEGR